MRVEITKFNKQKDYEEQVQPIIENLKKVCNDLKLPFVVSVCIQNTGSGTQYESEMLSAYANELVLKNDIFPNMVNVLNGFDTIPHQEIEEINYTVSK